MKNFKKLIITTKVLLSLSILAASVNAFSATSSPNIEDIYQSLTQTQTEAVNLENSNPKSLPSKEDYSSGVQAKSLIQKTNQYYQDLFNQLKDKNLTTLKTIPKLNVFIEPLTTLNSFNMRAFNNTPQVDILYNVSGDSLNFSTSISAEQKIKQANLSITPQDLLEFSILHETAHIQHFNNPQMFNLKALSLNENKTLNKIFKPSTDTPDEIDISLKSQLFENYADFVASIWYLQKNDFSPNSIEKLKDVKTMREITHNDGSFNNNSIDEYKTFNSINYVINHIEEIKKMNASQINSLAVEVVSNNSFNESSSLNDFVKPNSVIATNLSSLKNKIQSFRQKEHNYSLAEKRTFKPS